MTDMNDTHDDQPNGDTLTLAVPEITCGHCTSTIEAAVTDLDGVRSVTADVETKTVTVTGGDADTIVAAIEDTGFDVVR